MDTYKDEARKDSKQKPRLPDNGKTKYREWNKLIRNQGRRRTQQSIVQKENCEAEVSFWRETKENEKDLIGRKRATASQRMKKYWRRNNSEFLEVKQVVE